MKIISRFFFSIVFVLFILGCGTKKQNGSESATSSESPSDGGIDSLEEEIEPDAPTGPCLTIVSWNIANLGKSKDDSEIAFMADMVDEGDIVVIQEVVAGNGGAQAVARLADALNRRGAKWDYVVSNPTSGSKGSERYAYFWKPKNVKLKGKAWLETNSADWIDREPYMARFQWGTETLLLANLHAVPKNKFPNVEIEKLKDLPNWYPDDAIVLMGDCNSANTEYGGQALYKNGFKDALKGERTTLKMKPDKEGRVTANPYDHIYFEKAEVKIHDSGAWDFSGNFDDLKSARLISDHIPVWACLSLR
jgi:deoxyribonuclease-1-like protein